MKKPSYLFLAFASFFIFRVGATDTLKFDRIKDIGGYVTSVYKEKYAELTFFKHRLISPTLNIYDTYQGRESDSILNFTSYLGFVNDLDLSNFNDDSIINVDYIENRAIEYGEQNTIPISLTVVEYHLFKDSTIALNYIDFQNNQFVDNSPSNYFPFRKDTLFAACALNQIFDNNNLNFILTDSLLLTNLNGFPFDSLLIDFDDGNGYKTFNKGQMINVNYTGNGLKIIRLKKIVGNRCFYAKFKIEIKAPLEERTLICDVFENLNTLPPDLGPVGISTTKLGTFVNGKYAVWYSNCNVEKKIRRPFIISAGYNQGNGKQLTAGLISTNYYSFDLAGQTIEIPTAYMWNGEWRGTYYETYNGVFNKRFAPYEYSQYCSTDDGNKFLDRLRDEGYDIIILSYKNGKDKTYNNAALLMELIEKINLEKNDNGYYFENVICGFSAGGLTVRLALALMESRYKQGIGTNPHTKLYVNFDGENQGGCIPLGLQHLIKFQKDPFYTIPSLNALNLQADIINKFVAKLAFNAGDTPLAREFIPYNANVNGNLAHPDRALLLSTFNNIPLNNSNGYPDFCRKVSVSQGSSSGTNINHTGSTIFDSKLGRDLSGTGISQPSTCGGNYPWVAPKCEKRTTARYWGANNNQNIFDGTVTLDASFTFAPMICVNINLPTWMGGGCHCVGPYTVYAPIQIKDKHIPKPNNLSTNYDDAPASTSTPHIELYNTSAYPSYNNLFAGQGFANYDPLLQSFCPTASVLDLHDPNNNYQTGNNFLSPVSLGLMNINDANNSLHPHPYLRYGFPYLAHPNDHYQITPFDGVYAIGTDNGNFENGSAKPSNQMHVENPQTFIGDYLTRVEVAPENLYLSNRDLGITPSGYIQSSASNPYKAEFEARDKIFVGKTGMNGENIYSINSNDDFLTPNEEFKVTRGAFAKIHAGDEIDLMPGTTIESGSEAEIFIQPFNCANNLRIMTVGSGNNDDNNSNSSIQEHSYGKNLPDNHLQSNDGKISSYPNPNKGNFVIENKSSESNVTIEVLDLTGKLIYTIKTSNTLTEINVNNIENGIYIIHLYNDNTNSHSKIIISK
jgi:hypothetical protein